MAAMAAGLLGGLGRLMASPGIAAVLLAYHGPLLAAVVFPGLISLERAVAIGKAWAWSAPALAMLALLHTLLSGRPAALMLVLIALGMMAQQLFLWRRSPGLDGEVGALAVLALLGADWAWSQGASVWPVALGWASFLILLIAAERLELSFLARSGGAVPRAMVLAMLLGVGLNAPRAVGLGWLALALWLSAHDLARRNARRAGLPAYSARAVLLGYGWLGISGLQLLVWGAQGSFDRILHGIFVGFVLSMVMAHGPIIFPALLKCNMGFSGWFYLPLAVLHASLLWRCFVGLSHGALGNLAAALLFMVLALAHLGRGQKPWLAG
jgi:hypothetical protein